MLQAEVKSNLPIPDAVLVIVTGTLVADFYKSWVYGSLQREAELRGYLVEVLCIPRLGLYAMDVAAQEMCDLLRAKYPDRNFILAGHSQGGSQILGLKRLLGRRVIAAPFQISAPNHGTQLARLGAPLRFLPAIGGMAPHSRALRALRDIAQVVGEAEEVEELGCISVMTMADFLVVPFWHSLSKEAQNVVVAPKSVHSILKRLGFRRSNGVELVEGLTEHLFIVKHSAVLRLFGEWLDGLTGEYWIRATEFK